MRLIVISIPLFSPKGAAPRRERPAITEERAGVIRFRAVENDGSPESMILLTGLKNIFQRQLPKMPREYITRLVLDRNHQSLAIVKRGLQVVGGITYRPFNHRKFAEIVFCAISSTEQVKVRIKEKEKPPCFDSMPTHFFPLLLFSRATDPIS